MTIKELRAQIRQETMDINRRLISYYEDDKRTKILDREIEYLKRMTGTAEGKTYLTINEKKSNDDLNRCLNKYYKIINLMPVEFSIKKP